MLAFLSILSVHPFPQQPCDKREPEPRVQDSWAPLAFGAMASPPPWPCWYLQLKFVVADRVDVTCELASLRLSGSPGSSSDSC